MDVDPDGGMLVRWGEPREATLLMEQLARKVSLARGGRLLCAKEMRAVDDELKEGRTIEEEVAGRETSGGVESKTSTRRAMASISA